MPAKQFIYFVEGATDSVDDFDAQGVSFVPLAGGPVTAIPRYPVITSHPAPRLLRSLALTTSRSLLCTGA